MKQFEIQTKHTYKWWREDGQDIKPEHVETLKENAEHRMANLIPDGFTSGRLHTHIMNEVEGEFGVNYTGHWEVEIVEE